MGLDGIMVIHGVDGRLNEESAKLTNWLFSGKSGYQITRSTFLGNEYKELFYIIKKDFTSFFYLPKELYTKIEQ